MVQVTFRPTASAGPTASGGCGKRVLYPKIIGVSAASARAASASRAGRRRARGARASRSRGGGATGPPSAPHDVPRHARERPTSPPASQTGNSSGSCASRALARKPLSLLSRASRSSPSSTSNVTSAACSSTSVQTRFSFRNALLRDLEEELQFVLRRRAGAAEAHAPLLIQQIHVAHQSIVEPQLSYGSDVADFETVPRVNEMSVAAFRKSLNSQFRSHVNRKTGCSMSEQCAVAVCAMPR